MRSRRDILPQHRFACRDCKAEVRIQEPPRASAAERCTPCLRRFVEEYFGSVTDSTTP